MVYWFGFIIACIASISTFLGALTSLTFRKVNQRTLAVILGFAAGIMLYTAFMKLMPDAVKILAAHGDEKQVKWMSTALFFVGIGLLYPLGYLVSFWKRRERRKYDESTQYYRKIAILILLTISAHSLVEGAATFLSYLSTPWVAIPLLLSIIVHNYPEGMTIGALFNKISETMGRRRALVYSLVASLCEPWGALIAYHFMLRHATPIFHGLLKAFLSGLLVATALNELIPNAQLQGKRRISVQSIIAGMFVMGLVLVGGSLF